MRSLSCSQGDHEYCSGSIREHADPQKAGRFNCDCPCHEHAEDAPKPPETGDNRADCVSATELPRAA